MNPDENQKNIINLEKKDRTAFLLTVTLISLFVGMAGLVIALQAMQAVQNTSQVPMVSKGDKNSQKNIQAVPVSSNYEAGKMEEMVVTDPLTGEEKVFYLADSDEIAIPDLEPEPIVEEIEPSVEEKVNTVSDSGEIVELDGIQDSTVYLPKVDDIEED